MKTTLKLSVIALSLALTACSSSDDDDKEQVIECTDGQELVDGVCEDTGPKDEAVGSETIYGPLNTSSQTVYFDLDTKTDLELTDEAAKSNNDWDIAINRYTITLNSNDEENPAVIYNVNNNAEFYDEQGAVTDAYLNSTVDSELQDYLDVNFTDIPADDSEFTADVSGNAFNGNWYNYNTQTHAVTANDTAVYYVQAGGGRSAAATYSGFNVADLNMDSSGFAVADITLNIAYALSNAAGAEVTMDDATELFIDSSACTDADAIYVSFATGSTVAADADHDLVLACAESGSIELALNAADGKSVYYDESGSFSIEAAAHYTYRANEYTIPALNEISPGNYGPFAYAIGGGHLMWSDFNVYIIKKADKYYKIQVTGYYNEENASGNISLRADEIPTS